MKKYQYIVAVACVLLGAAGFAGWFAIDQMQEDKKPGQVVEGTESEKLPVHENSELAKGDDTESESEADETQVADAEETESESQPEQVAGSEPEEPEVPDEAPVGTVQDETLHFQPEKGLIWPIEGPVLMDYSMDATVYYKTLQQYQYNPAMVIGGTVNSKVYYMAKGKITSIETNEVTGCTVTQDLGDGYTAVYGQLKDVTAKVGDVVQSGQVVGYVADPTKYYTLEGPNVYFKLLKDGTPIDPDEILIED